MTSVLDATVAGASANAYITVADADALAGADLGHDAEQWLLAETADKEKAIVRATRMIDSYRGSVGTPYAADQALLYPRETDVASSVAFIQRTVRLAVYEQAIYVLQNADTMDEAGTRRARGLLSFSDDDGSGSVLPLDPAFGLMAPRALSYLAAVPNATNGRLTLTSVPYASSYPT